jgi:hypothetical protein
MAAGGVRGRPSPMRPAGDDRIMHSVFTAVATTVLAFGHNAGISLL